MRLSWTLLVLLIRMKLHKSSEFGRRKRDYFLQGFPRQRDWRLIATGKRRREKWMEQVSLKRDDIARRLTSHISLATLQRLRSAHRDGHWPEVQTKAGEVAGGGPGGRVLNVPARLLVVTLLSFGTFLYRIIISKMRGVQVKQYVKVRAPPSPSSPLC